METMIGSDVMTSIYVREQGATVRKHGEKIVITKSEETLLEIPMIKVSNIAVFGNVQLTTQALQEFLSHGIGVNYFSFRGKHLGHVEGDYAKNVMLRLKQYQLYEDKLRSLELAKVFVMGKIQNQLEVVRRYRWNAAMGQYKQEIDQMRQLLNSICCRENTEELMGAEGICSRLYFDLYGHMLKNDMVFSGRVRQPAKDPVNALLNLGYSFLEKEICNVLEAEGFDCCLGILHGIRYGRKSLVFDMMEEFRQPVVDRFVLLLLNKRMLSMEDFLETEEGMMLSENAFKKFCREFEGWITGENIGAGEASFRKRMK